MTDDGNEFIFSVLLDDDVHPFASVTVTVYEPACETVTHCVVAPVLHKYDESCDGAHHCVDEPEQTEPFPVMVDDGNEFILSVLLDDDVHPFASVTVTVNVAACDTVIHCVVAPVLHK